MSSSSTSTDNPALFEKLDAAVAAENLTESASRNIRIWLTESRYQEYRDQVVEHIEKYWCPSIRSEDLMSVVPGSKTTVEQVSSVALGVQAEVIQA